jgi:hypothetical protein
MLDLGPIANIVKAAQPPPPQAQPSVAEAMKPVPETEIQTPVPPPPAKGGEPGLGEHFDAYDTEMTRTAAQPKEAKALQVIPDDAPTREVQAQLSNAKASEAKEAEAKKEKERAKLELLGKGTGLPQPSTDPLHLELPFLKPLGQLPPAQSSLGQAIDARI